MTNWESLELRRYFSDLPVADIGGPYTVDEGLSIQLDASALSDTDGTVEEYFWDFDYDGETFDVDWSGVSPEFGGNDGPTIRNIALRVQDNDGDMSEVVIGNITISNVDPVINVDGDENVSEGVSYSITWSAFDPGDDTISSWTVNWGDGSELEEFDANTQEASHTYTSDGLVEVTVTATDEDGSDAYGGRQVTVLNVTPEVSIQGNETTIEGSEYSITFSAMDPGDIPIESWEIDWGDGSEAEFFEGDATGASHTYVNDAEAVITVIAHAADDDSGINNLNIVVTNAAPEVSDIDAPEEDVIEGDELFFSAEGSDAGANDELGYSWTVTKDGEDYVLGEGVSTDGSEFAFTPTDEGTYEVTVTVTDDSEDSSSASTGEFDVENADPSVEIIDVPESGEEGSELSFGSEVSDLDSEEGLDYLWSVTIDGDEFELPGEVSVDGSEFTFTPTDDGTYVVSLTVEDVDGGSTTVSTEEISVSNVDPSVNIFGIPDWNVEEGSQIEINADASDIGTDDDLEYLWSVTRDGDEFELPNDTVNDESLFQFVPTDNGEYVITVEVSDGDGGSASDSTFGINVINADPDLSIDNVPNDATEGSAIIFSADVSDPGSEDEFSYQWTILIGDEEFSFGDDAVLDESEFEFTPPDQGSYEVRLSIVDDDGGEATASETFTVENSDPIGVVSNPEDVKEGRRIRVSAEEISDSGEDDLSYSWTVLLDGSEYALEDDVETDKRILRFRPRDNGEYVIILNVEDGDGGTHMSTTVVEVANDEPEVFISGMPDEATREGGALLKLRGIAEDAGVDDVLEYRWAVLRDGKKVDELSEAFSDEKHFKFEPDDDGSYVVRLTVRDDDGGVSVIETTEHEVLNAPPKPRIEPVESAVRDQKLEFEGSFTDAGAGDTHEVKWDFGDGEKTTFTDADKKSLTPSHTYDKVGKYTVTMTIRDDDGGARTFERTVRVRKPALSASQSVFAKQGAIGIGRSNAWERDEEESIVTA